MRLSLVAGGLLLSSPPAPRADAPWLRWHAPPGCPGGQRVEALVGERLARAVAPGEIEVDARLEPEPTGFRVDLTMTRGAAVEARTLEASECEVLADATALLVAVTVDPLAASRRRPTPQRPSIPEPTIARAPRDRSAGTGARRPTSPIASSDEVAGLDATASSDAIDRLDAAAMGDEVTGLDTITESSETMDPPRRSTSARPSSSVTALGGLALGTTPGLTGGPSLAWGLLWPRLRLELAGLYSAPRLRGESRGAVSVSLGVVRAGACARLGTTTLELPLCGGVEVGTLRGEGRRAVDARTTHATWLAAALGLGLTGWWHPRIAPVARVDLVLPVAYPAFELRSADAAVELFRPWVVSGRLWLGVELKFFVPDDGSRRRRRRGGAT